MKNKIVLYAIVIIVIAGGIWVIFSQKNNSTDGFLYVTGSIPQDKLIPMSPTDPVEYFDIAGLKGGACTGCKKSPAYLCKDSGKVAEQIEFYNHPAPPMIQGGGSYRRALVCGPQYWILDYNEAFGYKIYGPFQK